MENIINKIKSSNIYGELLIIYKKIKYHKIFKELKKINILNDTDSINKILDTKKSVARFGDGEINFIISKGNSIGFQKSSEELEKRLTDIFNEKQDEVLIGIPLKFNDLSNDKLNSRKFWTNYIVENRTNLVELLDANKEYINTNFTRFYMDYVNKKDIPDKVKLIRKIWEGKDIVIVEGSKTKMGVGNDFFDNSSSIKRIICPSTDAFASYDNIINAIKENVTTDKQVIIALGPTATVLAYDLAKLGYQALDMGHVDIEYEWYIKGVNEKVAIEGKYVNEKRDDAVESINIDDDKYIKSIIVNLDNETPHV